MKPVLAIPVGRGRSLAGISDAESHKQLREVIGAVRMHANRLGNHAIEIDSITRLGAAVLREREGLPQTCLAGRGIVAQGVVEIEDNCLRTGIKWLRRHLIRISWTRG